MAKRSLPGSDIFGTKHIKTDEFVLMAKVITADGSTAKQASVEIHALDDILDIMSMRYTILGQSFTKTGRRRKDSDLQSLISNRIDILVKELKELEKA